MNILLVTLGTSGDINPFLSIGRSLRELGHQAAIITQPHFQDQIEREGLVCHPCGIAWNPAELHQDSRLMNPGTGTFLIWKDIYLPFVEESYRMVRLLLQQGDVSLVLNHVWCFGGFLAAREYNVPYGMVALAPLIWFSREDQSVYGPQTPPSWLHRFLLAPVKLGLNLTLGRDLQKMCRRLGLPSLGRHAYFAAMQQADCNLGLWSPAWRGPASDDPPHSILCGFPGPGWTEEHPSLHLKLSAEVEQFLESGPPPVVLGLGSVLPQGALDVYRAVGEACLHLHKRAILVGVRPDQFPHFPDRILALPFAPYRALFPRACVTIHHAGIGTLSEALQAGHPSVVIPFANDQFDNARRCVKIGQAMMIPRKEISTSRMIQTLQTLFSNPAMLQQSKRLAVQIRADGDGARRAASFVSNRMVVGEGSER